MTFGLACSHEVWLLRFISSLLAYSLCWSSEIFIFSYNQSLSLLLNHKGFLVLVLGSWSSLWLNNLWTTAKLLCPRYNLDSLLTIIVIHFIWLIDCLQIRATLVLNLSRTLSLKKDEIWLVNSRIKKWLLHHLSCWSNRRSTSRVWLLLLTIS